MRGAETYKTMMHQQAAAAHQAAAVQFAYPNGLSHHMTATAAHGASAAHALSGASAAHQLSTAAAAAYASTTAPATMQNGTGPTGDYSATTGAHAGPYSNYFTNNAYSSYAAGTTTAASSGYGTSHQHPLPAAVPTNLPWY